MESAVGVGIFEEAVVLFIEHTHLLLIIGRGGGEVVPVDEVVAGIVGRIDVYQLDLIL